MGLILPQYIDPPTTIREIEFSTTNYHEFNLRPEWYSHSEDISLTNDLIHRRIKKFKTYACKKCRTHLSSSQEIMSRDYRGKTGDAYLMGNLVNIEEGNQETRVMMTGEYVVCDINCQWCHQLIGWKYLKSDSASQRYKEGRYIMELKPVYICE
ncbi:similar to Saccharomyces cerevisiae YBL049W MOH1 Protein of unknown function, has homology to kinase Snf7p [Maudiozyma barnettii]|uniref:Protein yippee-like n=1 Tax=Maudiozyma barnettii TaxID=61262 RepID=A0A8H2VHN8_9SACH|nr:Moh1p [Kazachstania barnettii]CAB4255621.1 similar to Saccharomyces cerevisiae YBL049W MOH1 Protein of unknown function, has homology to kinase Snf7p [Kazachstania barnettii]CAD1784182.1 similar to Saccharomyces cerevisiae YBL049W MOH1 Protein of unknown function, has homology to kinase Snf7p [Kazachstania barnettii]